MASNSIIITTASGTVGSANQTLAGTGTPGASIGIWNGNTQVATTTVSNNGTWSVGVTLNLGNNTISANMLATMANFKSSVGMNPNGNLIADAAGNLLGIASLGGASNQGSIFQLSGNNYQTITNILSFNGSNGAYPFSGLIEDSSGNIFGTTQLGGSGKSSVGTVFELSGANHQTLTTLYSFNTGNAALPLSNLVMSASGSLIGATMQGGSFNKGTIFELSGPNFQTYKTLVNFNGTNGYQPNYLMIDPSGRIFGLSTDGGSNNLGTVFQLSGSDNTTLTTLVNFSAQTGNYPTSLIEDANGNLFGVTIAGGSKGSGTIFELNGANFQNFSVLYNFPTSNLENPSSNLVIDTAGNLYGELSNLNGGSIFELSGPNYQTFTTLNNFSGSNGGSPNQLAIIGGVLYGVTSSGGSNQNGTVFQITSTPTPTNLSYVPSNNFSLTALTPNVSEASIASFKITTSTTLAGTWVYYTLSSTNMNLLYGSQASSKVMIGSDGTALIQIPVGYDGVVQSTPQSLSIGVMGMTATETINALPANLSNTVSVSKSSFLHGETIPIKVASNFLTGAAIVRISGISANYFVLPNGVLQSDGSIVYPVNLVNGVATINLNTQVSVQNGQYGSLGLNASKTQMTFQVELCTSGGYSITTQNVTFNEPSITGLMASQSSVAEGSNATFLLSTSNILSGTTLNYTLFGLDPAILNNGPSTGIVQVSSTSQTIISIPSVVPFGNLGSQNFSIQVGKFTANQTLTQPSIPSVTWPLAAGGAWNTASNWTSGMLPNLSTNVNIVNSSTVLVSGSASAYTLTLSNTPLSIQTNSLLNATYLYSANSDLDLAGNLNVSSAIVAYRTINLSGGSINAGTITGNYGYIQGYGIVNANFTGANAFYASAQGSTSTNPVLQINGALSLITTSTNSTVNTGSTLELNNTTSSNFNIPVQMLGTNATLKLDNPGLYTGSISSFVFGDQLDLAGFIATSVSYSAGVLSVVNASGKTLTFNLAGSLLGGYPIIASDGSGGTIVSFSKTPPVNLSLTASASQYIEGQSVVLNLVTSGLSAGAILPYTLSGVSASDIASGQLSGTVTVDANGLATLTIPTLTHMSNLGNKTLGVTITGSGPNNSSSTASVSTTLIDNATLKGMSFGLSAKSTSLVEGNNAVFTLTSSSIPNGTIAQFSISGSVGPGDYTSISNSVVFNNGQATISIPTTVHAYSLGNKTMSVNVDGQSASVTLIDNSPSPPIYSITPTASSVNAGQTVIFTVNTINVPFGSSVNYTISGVSAANVVSGQLSGSVMIASPGVANISIPTTPSSSYQGNKTMTVSVNGVSASETLIDMAAKPTYTLKANASSVNFGSAASFSLSTTNLPNATQVFYTLSGVSAASDLGSANLTGSVNIDPSGKATISIPTLNHTGFQGNKTLTLTINDQTASETLIDTNQALNISATSASVIEGNNANFIVSSVNVPVGTAVPYSITGSVAATDLKSGSLTGSVVIDAGGVTNLNISTITHPTFQGNKTMTVTLGNSSATLDLIDKAVLAPDQFDGTYLSINKLMMGGVTYSNMIVTVSSVVSIANGLPATAYDTYDATTQRLTAPVIQFGNTIYTNAVLQLTSNSIVAQNGGLVNPPSTTPPNISLLSQSPLNKTSGSASSDVIFTFSQFITPSAGNITITAPNGQQSLLDITSNPYIQISGNTLTVLHSNFYQTSGPYQFSIPSGIIHGVSGGNFVGVSDYSVNLTGLSS